MQVAVAGVEDVGHRQVVALRERRDVVEHRAEFPTRDGAIHAVVIRRQPPRRRESRLAPAPKGFPFGFGAGQARLRGAGFGEDGLNAGGIRLRFRLVAIQFAQKDRRGIPRIAGMGEVFRGLDGECIHHLQPGRHDAAADDGAHGVSRAADVVKGREQHPFCQRRRQELHHGLRDDAEHPFGADHRGQQVIPRRVQRLAAEHQFLAFDGLHSEAEDVVQREAIFQAMHAAGVLRDVAADAARDLGRRVWRVVEAVGRHRLGDLQVDDARLHPRRARRHIHLQDAVHLREREQHGIRQRPGTPGEARAGAPRHHRHGMALTDGEHRPHLLHAFR